MTCLCGRCRQEGGAKGLLKQRVRRHSQHPCPPTLPSQLSGSVPHLLPSLPPSSLRPHLYDGACCQDGAWLAGVLGQGAAQGIKGAGVVAHPARVGGMGWWAGGKGGWPTIDLQM
jgi:hypothetical protein